MRGVGLRGATLWGLRTTTDFSSLDHSLTWLGGYGVLHSVDHGQRILALETTHLAEGATHWGLRTSDFGSWEGVLHSGAYGLRISALGTIFTLQGATHSGGYGQRISARANHSPTRAKNIEDPST